MRSVGSERATQVSPLRMTSIGPGTGDAGVAPTGHTPEETTGVGMTRRHKIRVARSLISVLLGASAGAVALAAPLETEFDVVAASAGAKAAAPTTAPVAATQPS